MKLRHIAIGVLMLIGGVGCTHKFDNHKNTPSENFEALWQIIDEKYCLFDDKKVDWDSVYAVYQPQFDTMKLVAFGAPEAWRRVENGERVSALVQVEENEWNGLRSVEGRILDLRGCEF